jgi:hypothetical protein
MQRDVAICQIVLYAMHLASAIGDRQFATSHIRCPFGLGRFSHAIANDAQPCHFVLLCIAGAAEGFKIAEDLAISPHFLCHYRIKA